MLKDPLGLLDLFFPLCEKRANFDNPNALSYEANHIAIASPQILALKKNGLILILAFEYPVKSLNLITLKVKSLRYFSLLNG